MIGNIIILLRIWFRQNISCRHHYHVVNTHLFDNADYLECAKCGKISSNYDLLEEYGTED